jgi:hypothetical protein
MPASLIQYRLRIRNASSLVNPDGTADALVVSSVPSDGAPFLASPPSGDGQEVDPITGAVRTGSYTVEVVDANTGTDATGTIRYLTSRLEDATFRQQLISRRAYVEIRTDGGAWSLLLAGYVLGVRLISPMRYAIAVGDTRRVEQSQEIFQGGSLGGYTTRGCILGGPVTSDWGPVKSRGGWRYRVSKSGNDVALEFIDGYAATFNAPVVRDWRKVTRPETLETIATYRTVNPYALGGASQFVTAYTTAAYDFSLNDWSVAGGVVAYVGTTATNAVPARALLVSDTSGPTTAVLNLFWPGCPHNSGDIVFVALSTVDVTGQTPLYLDAHPVDLVTAIWANARVRYDAAGAWIPAMRALIGDTVRLACRFTEAPTIAEFLEQAIYGPFGIASRTTTDGLQELFPTRIRTDVLPSLTVGTAALRSADPVVFDLDESSAVSAIALTQQVFNQAIYSEGAAATNGYTATQSQGDPLDGVLVATVTQTAQYLDPNLTVFAGREINYRVPGMIHTVTDWTPNTTPQLDAIAVGVFDRFGRGASAAEVEILAGTSAAAAQVGDEVYFEGPSFPNRGYRIGESTVGPRIMQVVRRTETPSGPTLKLLDSGLAAQPATAATITIAAFPGAPTTTAMYTITNAATLNATGVISVRVEWATGASTPSGGADHAIYAPGQIPTSGIALPPLTSSGQRVWVRARSEQAGRRPSAWTAWTSVVLTSLPTITGVTISNVRVTAATVSWTNTSSTLPVVVFAAPGSGAPASWTPFRVASVPAGSTLTVVRNLTGPFLPWTIGLAYESATTLGPVAAATLTTTSLTDTTNRPAALAVIPGVDDVTLAQGVALAMWPADQTLDLVIERSLTSGSGFAEIARVAGSTPTYVDVRPRNGLTYYYRIAHLLGGFRLSPYSQEVAAVASGVPRDAVRPGAVGPVIQVETTEVGTTGTVTLTITDPQGRAEQVRFRHRTGGGAWSAWTVDTSVPYSYSATIPSSGFLDIQYEVNGYNAAGVSGLLAGGTESFDLGVTANIVSATGTFSLAGALTIAVQGDTDTNSLRYAVATTDWANDAAALAAATAGTLISARNATVVLTGPYAAGTTVYVAFAGYTGAGGTGTVSGPFRYAFINGVALGPSLNVVTTPSANSYSLVVTWDGTIAYALDGVSQSVSGWTSPRTVTITRNDYLGATQVAAFAVTKDSATVSESVNVPPKDNANATITIGTQTADDVTNTYTFSWSTSGMPTGTTFDLTYTTTTTAGVVEQGTLNNQTSPVSVVSGYSIGLDPKYQMTVTAITSGTLLLSKSRSGTFLV